MLNKGFIGFWGSRLDNIVLERLLEYKNILKDSRCFSMQHYVIVASSEYVYKQDKQQLEIRIGQPDNFITSLFASVEINDVSVLLKRDRWGTRNIYYCKLNCGIIFSSDIKYILSLPITDITEYDEMSLEECASLGYIYENSNTLFKKIKQLPRNTELLYKKNELTVKEKVISCAKDKYPTFEEAYLDFKHSFESTVKKYLGLKGKRVFLLSGGMDSSALVIAASRCNERLNTISFMSNNNISDILYARKIAKMLKSNHIEIAFNEHEALYQFPFFLNSIENVEFEGIFSFLGGFSYFLLCSKIKDLGFNIVYPGEGADEILGGYYWQLTHPFGFVDSLKKLTETLTFNKIISLFPDVEEKKIYREIAYYFLQGTALTNYHLSCIEHSARFFDIFSCPIYMDIDIYDVIKNVPMKWLCDDNKTKIILRKYLLSYLMPVRLKGLVNRKKLAMPSVITDDFVNKFKLISQMESRKSKNPFTDIIKGKPENIFMLDVFHKYYTKRPLEKIDIKEWQEDIRRIEKHESIVHW